MKKTVAIFILMISTMIMKSQIYLQNNTSETVSVAIAMHYDWSDFKGWISQGWYIVEPNEKKMISEATGFYPTVYYYATSKSKKYEGNRSMLVNDEDSFAIKNCDMDYAKEKSEKYKWAKFRPIEIKLLKTKYTIELDY
jgi:uncharacterized membrane protein